MAIKALAWMVRSFEPPVYCYHEIVHNRLVVDRFRDLGVEFVDDISEVPEGRPVMLSAHGSAPEVVEAARARGSYMVDAVCPLVTKVHHEVKVRAGKGYRIVYVGHDGHEEAVGTMAVAPDAISRRSSSLSPCSPRRRCRTGTGRTCSMPPETGSRSSGCRGGAISASPPPTGNRR
jgi:4-hydroxy-3-methylbut-2-enyl diphosphate reductase